MAGTGSMLITRPMGKSVRWLPWSHGHRPDYRSAPPGQDGVSGERHWLAPSLEHSPEDPQDARVLPIPL